MYPRFHEIRNFREARGTGHDKVSGRINSSASISAPPFSQRTLRATVADLTGSPGPMLQPLGSGSLKGIGAEASALCAFILLLPSPLLHCIFFLRPRRCRPATMVKAKMAALERAKKATAAAKGKKMAQGTSSRSGLPPSWIQGLDPINRREGGLGESCP